MPIDERLIRLVGATNFRDIGGYRTTSGGSVRRGRAFRSDSLQDLTPADIDQLLALGLRKVIDLRSPREVEAFGATPLTDHGVVRRHVGFFPEPAATNAGTAEAPRPPIPDATDHAAFSAHYLDLLEGAKPSIALAFLEIAQVEDDSHAVVFHCTAGRDRTGLTAALLLSLLGVDDETVGADYQLTEQYLRFPESRLDRMRAIFGDHAAVRSVEAPPTPAAVMHLTLAGLRQRYGAVHAYLQEAGVTDEVSAAIKRRLL